MDTWADTNEWILENTCPECHQLQCRQGQGLEEADKIIFYICSNPECSIIIFNARHDSEWQTVNE